MKFSVDRSNLKDAVVPAAKVAKGSAMIPIYEHLLLVAEGDRLVVWGTDPDATIIRAIEAEVSEAGEAVVRAADLKAVASKVRASTIQFERGGDGEGPAAGPDVEITAGKFSASLPSLDPGEFPRPRSEDPQDVLDSVPAETLRDAFTRTAWAASSQDSRPALMCAMISTVPGQGKVEVSNGHVLARAVFDAEVGDEVTRLSARPEVMQTALATLKGDEATVSVRRDENYVQLVADDGSADARVRRYGGDAPNTDALWNGVVDHPISFRFARDEMQGAVERVAILASQDHPKIVVEFDDDGCTISLNGHSDRGSATERVAGSLEGYDFDRDVGENGGYKPLRIGFNPNYLLEALDGLDCELVNWRMKAPNQASHFVADLTADEDPDVVTDYIVMPLRLLD